MKKKLGIETIKKSIDFALKLFYKIQALSGKWFMKIISLCVFAFQNRKAAIYLFRNYKLIIAEYNDIDKKERLTLNLYFVNKFEIENQKLEIVIEKIFKILTEISDIINLIKRWKK